MKRRRFFDSDLKCDLEYKELPRVTDPEILEQWVQTLRDGSLIHYQDIIKAHLRIIMSIVSEFASRYPNKHLDLVGEASLGLTQAVALCGPPEFRLHDNNITPYITTSVRGALKDFVARDRVVYMPPRTFHKKAAAGEIKAEGNNPILANIRIVLADVPYVKDDALSAVDSKYSFVYPVAKQEEPSIEFNEAVELAIQTETERKVIDLRAQGHTYKDIATILGCHTSRVGQIMQPIEERFNHFYTA